MTMRGDSWFRFRVPRGLRPADQPAGRGSLGEGR